MTKLNKQKTQRIPCKYVLRKGDIDHYLGVYLQKKNRNVTIILTKTLQWRHNERHGVSNHDYLLSRLFRHRSITENFKALRHWPFLWGEFIGDQSIPRTNGQYCGKCFHSMTSSWVYENCVREGWPMMAAWQGNTLRITGPWCGESTHHTRIFLTKCHKCRPRVLLLLLACMKFSTNNRVSGDSWRLMWRHCNLLPYLSGEICQDARRCEAKRDGVIWSDDQHCGWQAGRVLSEIPAAAQAHTWHLHSRHQYWLTLLGQGPLRSRVSVRAAGIHVLRRRGTWLCSGEGTST